MPLFPTANDFSFVGIYFISEKTDDKNPTQPNSPQKNVRPGRRRKINYVRIFFYYYEYDLFLKVFSRLLFWRSQCSLFAAIKTSIALANTNPALPGDEVFSGWLFPRHLSRAQVASTCPRAYCFTDLPEIKK